LLVMALLLSVYNRSTVVQSGAGFIRSVHHCHIDYWCPDDDPWVLFLKERVPPSLAGQIHFRNVLDELPDSGDEDIRYPTGTGAIQLRPGPGGKIKIWCWYPGEDRSVMAPFENWFWRTTRIYHRERLARAGLDLPPLEHDDAW